MANDTGTLPPWGVSSASFGGNRAPWLPGYRAYMDAVANTRVGGYQPLGNRNGVVSTPQDRIRLARRFNASVSPVETTGKAINLAGV